MPEVASVKTIDSFIPGDQQLKLAAIRQLATVLDPVLRPDPNKKPPTDADNIAALKSAVDALKQSAGTQIGRGAPPAQPPPPARPQPPSRTHDPPRPPPPS